MIRRVVRVDEMRVSQGLAQNELDNVDAAVIAPAIPGLAGWVLSLLRSWRGRREMQREQLRLVETLSLGGKRQLMLVTCAGERFLVGGGPESVETIVRLKGGSSLDVSAESLDESCR